MRELSDARWSRERVAQTGQICCCGKLFSDEWCNLYCGGL